MRLIAAVIVILGLTGCSAVVKKGEGQQLAITQTARSNLVVNFQGDSRVEANDDWGRLRTKWQSALRNEGEAAGIAVSEQYGKPRGADAPGVLLLINVSNFRYLTTGMRYGFGVMTGNAWIQSNVSFVDLQSGETLGSRSYDTSSSAWEGVFSAMTEDQVAAISKEIIAEVKGARIAPEKQFAPPAGAPAASKEQQLQQLQQQRLPYEEYQKRYREIMGE